MPWNILIVGLEESCLNLIVEEKISVLALTDRICSGKDVDPSSFYLTHNGTPLSDSDLIEVGEDYTTTIIRAHPIIRGGKGGFGSLIRAMGTNMSKGNKREACRDLSGRRMRDVNAEKKMAQWLKDEPERQRDLREDKRKRLERKRAGPKHNYDGRAYMEQIKNTEETMDDALKQGLEASSSKSLKRKQPASNEPKKKPKLWLGIDDAELESDSESDGEQGSLESASSSDEASVGSGGSGDEPGPSRSPEELIQREDEVPRRSGEVGEESKEGDDCNNGQTPVSENDSTEQLEEGGGRVVSEKQKQQEGDSDNLGLVSEKPSLQQVEEGAVEEVPVVATETEKTSTQQQPESNDKEQVPDDKPIDLEDFSSAVELESVGPDRLKSALQELGLKCGGTLQQRAQRLFSTKGKKLDELDPSMFAKVGKQKKNK